MDETKLTTVKAALQSEIETSTSSMEKRISDQLTSQIDRTTSIIASVRNDFDVFLGGLKVTLPAFRDQDLVFQRDVTDRVTTLDSTVAALREDIAARLQQSDNREQHTRSKLRAAITAIDGRVNEQTSTLNSQLRSLQEHMLKELKASESRGGQELIKKMEFVRAEQDKMQALIDQNQSSAAGQLSKSSADFAELKTALREIQQRQKAELESFLVKTEEVVQERLTAQNKRFSKLQEEIDHKLADNLAAHQAISADLRQDLGQLRGIARSAQHKASENEAMSSDLSTQIKAIQTRIHNSDRKTAQTLDDFQQRLGRFGESEVSFKTEQSNNLQQIQVRVDDLDARLASGLSAFRTSFDEQQGKLQRAFDNLAKEVESTAEQLSAQSRELLEGRKQELTAQFTAFRDELLGQLETVRAKHREMTDDVKSSMFDLHAILADQYKPRITQLKKDLKRLEDGLQTTLAENATKMEGLFHLSSEMTKTAAVINKAADDTEKRFHDFSRSMRLEFIETKGSFESLKSHTMSEVSEVRSHFDSMLRELASLKQIHHHNSMAEQFQHRFEDTISYIQQFQRSMFRLLFPPQQQPDQEKGKIPPIRKQLVPGLNGTELFKVDVPPRVDLGLTIRNALQQHTQVSLQLPAKEVIWNKCVSLVPNQIVAIVGGRQTRIIMEGFNSIGDVADPSRMILEGFCILRMVGVKIEAKGLAARGQPTLDLNAIFVTRGWDATGISTVQLEKCDIQTDVPVVNVGASAVTHVSVVDSAITSVLKGKGVLYPVTVEGGGHSRGFGSFSTRNVTIARPKIEWLESPYLSHTDDAPPDEEACDDR